MEDSWGMEKCGDDRWMKGGKDLELSKGASGGRREGGGRHGWRGLGQGQMEVSRVAERETEGWIWGAGGMDREGCPRGLLQVGKLRPVASSCYIPLTPADPEAASGMEARHPGACGSQSHSWGGWR